MGIKYAQGEWILFLDADDLLLPNCVSSLLKAYQRYKTPIVVGRTYIYDKKANVRPFNINGSSGLVKNIFKDIFFEKLYVRMGNSILKKAYSNLLHLMKNWLDMKILSYFLSFFEISNYLQPKIL